MTSVPNRTCARDAVLLEDPLEVRLELGLLGEELGPVVGGLEAVAVEVVADVDPGAGVAVLPPGAAGAGVLLDDDEREARLAAAGSPRAGRTCRSR